MLYDDQAKHYDARAGLPVAAVEDIVHAIVGCVKVGDLLRCVELGAGTGELGIGLAQQPRWSYTAIDMSEGMLDIFGKRPGLPETAHLVQDDVNERWPVSDQSIDLVFTSRSVHHFDLDHFVAELWRVAAQGGLLLLVGSVQRDGDSVKALLRQEMRRRLAAAGFEGRSGKGQRKALFGACCERGAEMIELCAAARWNIEASPMASIDNWRNKMGLAGLNIPDGLKGEILDGVTQWASERWGALDVPQRMEERYLMAGVRLPERKT